MWVIMFFILKIESLVAECNFKSNEILSYNSTVNCLRSIYLSQTSSEVNNTIHILQQLLEMYVFKDIYLQAPPPHSSLSTNITQELFNVLKKSFDNTNDFYQHIADVFTPLKDPHTLFIKPCSRYFTFVLPFGVTARNSENNKTILFLTRLPSSSYYNIMEKFLLESNQTEEHFLGAEIQKLNVDGGELDSSDPAVLLNEWADENMYISKLSPSRFNAAIQRYFSVRTQSVFGIPKYFLSVMFFYKKYYFFKHKEVIMCALV
jgi:hypothetical protein